MSVHRLIAHLVACALATQVASAQATVSRTSVGAVDSVRVRGTVVYSATREPISSVRVGIEGSSRQVTTDERGNFALARVPSGSHVLSAHRLGFAPLRRTIVLEAGRDTSIILMLRSTPNRLEEIVTTGAGERQQLEIGNAVVTVNVDSIMAVTPVATVSDILQFRVPGLWAQRGSGSVGSPTRLRLRGNGSIESDNAPIIVVDGVRITNDAITRRSNPYAGHGQEVGGNDLSSRLDDLDPNSIESIEVMRGPAASTLYGSEAANGVIIIKSKRGTSGPPRWTLYADHQYLSQTKDYDFPMLQPGVNLGGGLPPNFNCTLAQQSSGTCAPVGDPQGFNMLRDPRFTPQATGHNQSIGGNVSGGSAGLQYFVGGTYLDQLGTAKLPEVNQKAIVEGRGGNPLPEEIIRPNARHNAAVNGRITGAFGGNSHFALGAGFMSQYQRVGNDGMQGLLQDMRLPTDTRPVDGWLGWYGTREQNVKHVTGNASVNWQPRWWGGDVLGVNLVYGWDFSLDNDEYLAPRESCVPLCQGTTDQGVLGYVSAQHRSNTTHTVTLGTSLNLPVTGWLSSHTRVGANYTQQKWYGLLASNTDLGVGRGLSGAGGRASVSELGDDRALAGWYAEEQLNFRHDRLFFTAGLRQDAGSAFGDAAVQPIYPKWNVSYVISEEPFFEAFRSYVPMLRLRFAAGNAGVMPASTVSLRTYSMVNSPVLENGDPLGLFATLNTPGNPAVTAEHSREYEGGFDAEVLNQRLALNFTWFRKYTWNAIDRTPAAGSVGSSVIGVFRANLGDVLNTGYELGATVRVVESDAIQYSVHGTLSHSSNELLRLAPGVANFSSLNAGGDLYSGNYARVLPGYPLFARWAYPILGWADANGNSIIDPTEVRVSDTLAYVGPSQPKYTAYMSHHVGLLRGRVTVDANFAYSGGMTQFNQAREAIQFNLARGQSGSDLSDQACVMATYRIQGRNATDWCFMETVKVLRFQNLSVGYQLPQSLLQHVGVKGATVRFTATNLAHWTNGYHGIDPGINTDPVSGNGVQAGAAFPAPRAYGVRLQLLF